MLPGLYADYNNSQRHSDVFRMSWDHTFRPTLLNHFFAGGNDWRENHDPPQSTTLGGYHWKDKVCLAGVPDCDENLLRLSFTEGYNTWGGQANNGSENTVYSFNDDLTWIKDKHTLKLGGMYQRNHYNGFGRQCIAGCVTFASKETGFPGDPNFTTGGGNPFASFLLGYVDSGSVDTIRFIGQEWPYFAGYFQDDWRFSSKLMLNLGIRWETTLPPIEENDRWMDFSPTLPNPGANNILGAVLFAGSGPGRVGTRSLANGWFGGFGPHIGLAYTLTSKTVIRASYSRSFAVTTTVTGSTHNSGFSTNPSYSSADNGVTPIFTLSGSFPGVPAAAVCRSHRSERTDARLVSERRSDPDARVQLVESLDTAATHRFDCPRSVVQRPGRISPSVRVVEHRSNQSKLLDYARARGPEQQYQFPGSYRGQAFPSRTQLSTVRWLRPSAPIPQYTGIDTWSGAGDHSGHSTYHAGIIKLEKRYASGLTFQTSYVFSKLMTDSDSYWVTDYGFRAADQYNRRLEKSIGQFDTTHNFKLGIVYDLPSGKGTEVADRWTGLPRSGRLEAQFNQLLLERHSRSDSTPAWTFRSRPMSQPAGRPRSRRMTTGRPHEEW